MLELPDEDIKAVITKNASRRANILEMNRKTQQMKRTNGNLKSEKYNNSLPSLN